MKLLINKQQNEIWKIPFRASGGKDSGSGMTAEQLFPAFEPQIEGLPTILQVKEEDNFRKSININVFGNCASLDQRH